MSHRKKLRITAGLGLLLLAAFLGYLYLTWAPAEPFRVRLDPAAPSSYSAAYVGAITGGGAIDHHVLLVENVTSAPMHLMRLQFYNDHPAASSTCRSDAAGSAWDVAHHTAWGQVIPPHGTAAVELVVNWSLTPDLIAGRSRVEHVSLSGTKARYVRVCRWLSEALPMALQRFVPEPKVEWGTTSVIAAEKSPPASP